MSADNTDDKKKLASALKRLVEDSTVHGLPKIVSSSRIAVKVLWCFMFIAAFVLFAIQLNGLIKQFNSNPKQTTITLASSKMKFPAITFCNMNVVKLSKVPLHSQLNELITPSLGAVGGAPQRYFVYPIKNDIYEALLKGYTIDDDFISKFPDLSYWGVVTHLRKIYFEYNEIPGDHNLEETLMSENELLVLLGEEIRTKTTPSPTTTTNSKMNKRETPGSSYTGAPGSYFAKSSRLEPTETHEASTSGTTEPNANETFPPTLSSTERFTTKTSNKADPRELEVLLTKGTAYEINHFGRYFGGNPRKAKVYGSSFEIVESNIDFIQSDNKGTVRRFPTYAGSSVRRPNAFFVFRGTGRKRYLFICSPLFDVPLRPDQARKNHLNDNQKYISNRLFNVINKSDPSMLTKELDMLTKYKESWTQEYGNCYTIDSPKYETRHSGLKHGFELVFDLEMDEYVTSVQESQGMRIVLHEPGTIPFANEEGITLAPGYDHQIGLKIIENSRLGTPYGDCTDGKEFQRNYKTNYTRTTCISICMTELLVKDCGCMSEDSPEILDEHVDLPVCEYSINPSMRACAERVKEKLIDVDQACNCAEPCSTTTYVKTISGKPWPTDEYMTKVIIDSLCDYSGRLKPSGMEICRSHWELKLDKKKYRNNFMKVQIYFEDVQYQIVKEEPTYGIVRFLSDIGGTAGLFIGASVLSIFEIFQVVLEIILYCQHKGKPQADNTTP